MKVKEDKQLSSACCWLSCVILYFIDFLSMAVIIISLFLVLSDFITDWLARNSTSAKRKSHWMTTVTGCADCKRMNGTLCELSSRWRWDASTCSRLSRRTHCWRPRRVSQRRVWINADACLFACLLVFLISLRFGLFLLVIDEIFIWELMFYISHLHLSHSCSHRPSAGQRACLAVRRVGSAADGAGAANRHA
jgi:hypothetical protein